MVKLSRSLLELSIFMDIEWLLSTLFDASLLSTLSRLYGRLFFMCCGSGQSRQKSDIYIRAAPLSAYLNDVPN